MIPVSGFRSRYRELAVGKSAAKNLDIEVKSDDVKLPRKTSKDIV